MLKENKCLYIYKHLCNFAAILQLVMNDKPNFSIEYLDEAVEFLRSVDVAARTNDPKKFKKLENSNIWEFRAEVNKLQYRLFAFWDTTRNAIVIATHGIIKKTQKTPKKEIDKAERIRTQYLSEKK